MQPLGGAPGSTLCLSMLAQCQVRTLWYCCFSHWAGTLSAVKWLDLVLDREAAHSAVGTEVSSKSQPYGQQFDTWFPQLLPLYQLMIHYHQGYGTCRILVLPGKVHLQHSYHLTSTNTPTVSAPLKSTSGHKQLSSTYPEDSSIKLPYKLTFQLHSRHISSSPYNRNTWLLVSKTWYLHKTNKAQKSLAIKKARMTQKNYEIKKILS